MPDEAPESPVNFVQSADLTPPQAHTSQAVTFQALAGIRGMGYASLAALWDTFKPIERIWDVGPEVARDVLRSAKNRQAEAVVHRLWSERDEALARAKQQLTAYENDGVSLVFRGDPRYPLSLEELDKPPRWLFVQGEVSLLQRQSKVAVVGTREPTPRGRQSARRAASALAEAGFVVVSGLAEGIDTEVHTAVLSSGGETIAVLGNGLSIDFPAGSTKLKQRIVDGGGAIVTEYLPNQSYSKRSFIDRNRIQAGLSCAVIPVQGARQGGTAHTVRFAQDLGRSLAGAWNERPVPTPENQMFEVLVEAGAPVFDLSEPAGVEALLRFFGKCAIDVRPPVRDKNADRKRAYGRVLRELRDVMAARDMNEGELEWLIEGIRKLRDQARHG